MRRSRALVPTINWAPLTASSTVSTTVAFTKTSSAEAARQSASGAGKALGLTSVNRVRPMFFIARATPPMLPGWLVCTRTTRILFIAMEITDLKS